MPELPEVETVRRGLAQHLAGIRLTGLMVRRGDLRVPVPDRLAETLQGRILVRIARRAKYLLLHFDNAQVLLVHLGMSGSIVLSAQPGHALRKHDHVIFHWENGMTATFHDPRRFGLMLLTDEETLPHHPLLCHLGPEPLGEGMDGDRLYALLRKTASNVKIAIMDQRKLVGVGNIYACEALFRAGILPDRPANGVTRKQAAGLCASIKTVLEAALASGGSTLRDYVRSSGDGGYFQHHFQVYGRNTLPCYSCGTPIRMMRQAGRSTFFCPHCQR